MAVTPHTITFTVYDTNNSTVLQGAKVYVVNSTKGTQSDEATTNSSGKCIIDLANLPIGGGQTVQYAAGDKILMVAYYQDNHDAATYTVAGMSKTQSLYMNPGAVHEPSQPTQRILTLVTGNTAGAVAYCKIYGAANGKELMHVETPANDSRIVPMGPKGLSCPGGMVIVREANTLRVSALLK